MSPKAGRHELRCFCGRHPLLAFYGINSEGKLFVHVKVYKQQRLFGEVLVTEGVVKLHCRECLRWHTVRIQASGRAVLEPDENMTHESEIEV